MQTEKQEKQVLMLSFTTGLMFAVIEFVFSISSHSHSVLMDAVYDGTELIFIALILFLMPLFHKPISEKHPYGFFQIESIFLIIKSFMMLAVTVSVGIEIIEASLSGGNVVDGVKISFFQFIQGILCFIIFIIMRRLSKNLSSPTITAELLGWKIDILYSLGMTAAFYLSSFLSRTPLDFMEPYVDSIIAVCIMCLTLPETIKILKDSIKDVFLFPPEEELVNSIKGICNDVLEKNNYYSVFFDITRTGRHIWIAVYFKINDENLVVKKYKSVWDDMNNELSKELDDFTCELLLVP